MLINPSRDVVVSLACYSYSKSVKIGGFRHMENDYLNGDVTSCMYSFISRAVIVGADLYVYGHES